METILVITNVVLAVVLIILILLQRSEGGALGLGLSQDNFASTRTVSNFLTKSSACRSGVIVSPRRSIDCVSA